MHFDTAALLEALEPPRLTHEGKEYVGRHLSILQWARFMTDVSRAAKNQLDLKAVQTLYLKLCDAWFPPPSLWRQIRGEPSVGRIMLSLPPAVQTELMRGFLSSQARALELPALGRPTPK